MRVRAVIIGATLCALAPFGATAASAAPDYSGPYAWTCGGTSVLLKGQIGDSESWWFVGQVVTPDGTKTGVNYIPTSWTITKTDLTTGVVVSSVSNVKGNGNANAQQDQVDCVVSRTRLASAAYGTALPPGVAPTDLIQSTTVVTAVPKGPGS